MQTKVFSDEYLISLLSRINKEEKTFLLMGDFNINLLNSDTKPEASEFFDNLPSHFFAPYILQPKRLNKTSKILVDNIVISTLEFGFYSGNFKSQISNHFLQFVILKDFLKKPLSNQSDSFERNYKFFDDDELKNDLKKIPWQNNL